MVVEAENVSSSHDADKPRKKYSSYCPYEKEQDGKQYPWTKEQRAKMSDIAALRVPFHYEELEKAGAIPPGETKKMLKSGLPEAYALHKYQNAVADHAGIPQHFLQIDLTKNDAPYSAFAQKYIEIHHLDKAALTLENDTPTMQAKMDIWHAMIDSYGSPKRYDDKMQELDKQIADDKAKSHTSTLDVNGSDTNIKSTVTRPQFEQPSSSMPASTASTADASVMSKIDLAKYGEIGFSGQHSMTDVEVTKATSSGPKQTVVDVKKDTAHSVA